VIFLPAFVLGICAEDLFGLVPLLYILTGALAVSMAWGIFRWTWFKGLARSAYPGMIPVFILIVLCGAFATLNKALLPADHVKARLEELKGREVVVIGRVVSGPKLKTGGLAPKQVFLLDLEQVEGFSCRGRVTVNLFGAARFQAGDRIQLTGKLTRPFDPSAGSKASYRAYLERQGIYAVLHVRAAAARQWLEARGGGSLEGFALSLRLRLEAVFEACLSPGEAGLMNAMLLGPRDGITPHVYDIFRKTGTAHIIAISGMNMTLTAVGVMFFLGLLRIERAPRAMLAVILLGFYALMAGNSAPVARSALMAGVVILSFIIERETDPFNTLALAALVLLAADPGQLKDIGFQLSFVCVASLLFIAPLILQPFEGTGLRQRPWCWFFIESAGITLAAFIGSAGILAYDFGYIAPVGLLVNLPVIPLMALVTALGALVLVAGLAAPVLAMPFALCLKVVLNVSVWILGMAAHVPVVVCPNLPAVWAAGYYAVLVPGLVWFSRGPVNDQPAAFIDKHLPV
jgi:competence protein ComEC